MSESPNVTPAIPILEAIAQTGRTQLLEHEVYRLLETIGVRVPAHRFVSLEELTISTERDLGSQGLTATLAARKIVLKVVAESVTHKEASGGVKIVENEPETVRREARMMAERFQEIGVELVGILAVSFVPHTQRIGNEWLVGFRQSPDMGPVVSLSKGGSDAEPFAHAVREATLLVPPMTELQIREALRRSPLVVASGRRDDELAALLAPVVTAFLELASLTSPVLNPDSSVWIQELEVNPFVVAKTGALVALDGLGKLILPEDRATRTEEPQLDSKADSIRPFFSPKGVTVVGVSSTDASKMGNIIAANLFGLGRRDVTCVNARGGTARFGNRTVPLYTSIRDIPVAPELVVVTVPAEAAHAVVEDAAKAGAKAVLLIPGGFSEATGDHSAEAAIQEVARRAGMRVVGPNCLGVIHAGAEARERLNTFFIPPDKFRSVTNGRAPVAILSQSGALALVQITNMHHAIQPTTVVSYGNALDVGPADLLEYVSAHESVRVAAFYVEGFRSGEGVRFADAVRRSRVPVVVYKAGRTAAGRAATESHTASLSGEYAVARSALKHAGAVVAETLEDYSDALRTVALLHGRRRGGTSIAMVTNAGYEKANGADSLGNLSLAQLSPLTVERLKSVVPPFVGVGPLLDVTPMAKDEVYIAAMQALLDDSGVHGVIFSIVPHSVAVTTTDREMAKNPNHLVSRVLKLAAHTDKPIVASITVLPDAQKIYSRMGYALEEGGIPVFYSARQAIRMLELYLTFHGPGSVVKTSGASSQAGPSAQSMPPQRTSSAAGSNRP